MGLSTTVLAVSFVVLLVAVHMDGFLLSHFDRATTMKTIRSHPRRYFLRRVPRLNMFNAKRNELDSLPISGLDTASDEVEEEVELELPEWDTRGSARLLLKPSFGFFRRPQFLRK